MKFKINDLQIEFELESEEMALIVTYTQSPLIRTTAKLPTLVVLKNSSNLDAHWFLIPQV